MKKVSRLLLTSVALLALTSCGPRDHKGANSSSSESSQPAFNFDYSEKTTLGDAFAKAKVVNGKITGNELDKITNVLSSNDYCVNKADYESKNTLALLDSEDPTALVDGNGMILNQKSSKRATNNKKINTDVYDYMIVYMFDETSGEVEPFEMDNEMKEANYATSDYIEFEEIYEEYTNIDRVLADEDEYNTLDISSLPEGYVIKVLDNGTEDKFTGIYELEEGEFYPLSIIHHSPYSDEAFYETMNLVKSKKLFNDYFLSQINDFIINQIPYQYYATYNSEDKIGEIVLSDVKEVAGLAREGYEAKIKVEEGVITSITSVDFYEAYYNNAFVRTSELSYSYTFSIEE